MGKTGFPLNNRPGTVLAEKGNKVVTAIRSTEKEEIVTVVASCSVQGVFFQCFKELDSDT